MIRISNVRKRFGAVQALDGVTLAVEPGERVALVGTNGSGKTTLLRALVGLLRVEGLITIDGVDMARQPEVALRSLAYVPQVAPPLDAPVTELVRAYCQLRGRSTALVEQRAARFGLDLRALGKTRVRDLSGGMKQKLLAALALAAEAPVLVCDEPTANLDSNARAVFFDEVNARPSSSILMLCSHRVDEVRHMVDRVVEFKDGRVISDAPISRVLAALQAFRVEVAFRDPAAGDAESAALAARGFHRLGPGRFSARFTQTAKVEAVGRLTSDYGDQLTDLSITEAESLADAGAGMDA